MRRVLSFSLGNLWRSMKTNNRADLIDTVRNLDIDGVEIILCPPSQIIDFKPSKDDISYLKSLKYVSLHPCKDKNMPLSDYKKWINVLFKIYKDVNAKNVVLHPNQLQNPEVNFKMNLITENMTPRKKVSNNKLENLMSLYNIGLCLDVSHSYLYSKFETDNLLKKFSNKIKQAHISGTYKRKDHLSLQKVSKDFLYSIRNIKNYNFPVIIEEDPKSKIDWKKEIELVRTLI